MNKIEFLSQFNDEENRISLLACQDFKSLIEDENYTYEYYEDRLVENFLNYKFLGKYDCDKIFGKMFDYEYTDTMNSFWTIFKQYIKLAKNNEFELENGEIKKDYIETYKKQYNSELTSQQLWIIHILNLLKQKNITFDKEIHAFATFTHSIGNFMEVPAGFNINRYANTLDYFDLTLLCIYKWYQTYSDFWLEILLNNNQQAIDNAKEWLLSHDFKTEKNYTIWQKFVIMNDLFSFVDDKLEPIEFFKDHFSNFEKLVMDKQKFSNYYEKEKLLNPQNVDDLIMFVSNINNSILERGELIAERELKDMNNYENTEIIFDKLIVTNKTNIEFPIVASIMNEDEFYEKATNGNIVVDELFFDIDLLDKDLYNTLIELNINISFFRTTPSYVSEKILDWKV